MLCLREFGIMGARIVSLTALLALVLLLLLDGREIVLENVDPRLRSWAARALGADEVTVGSIGFSLGAGEEPAGLVLNDVTIAGTDRAPSMTLPKIETGFQVLGGLTGRVRPTTITVEGVSIALGRTADGTLNLSADGGRSRPLPLIGGAGGPGFAALLQASDLFHEMDMLSRLKRVEIADLALSFQDARSGSVFRAEGARAYVARDDGLVSAGFKAAFVRPGAGPPVSVQATLQESTSAGRTRYAIRFDSAQPGDLAAQVEVLSWMRLIEAPVDGALAIEVDRDGAVAALSGSLRIGAGVLRPMDGAPVTFDGASIYFDYDLDADRFEISALEIATDHGRFRTNGKILVERTGGGEIDALIAQLDLASVTLAADSMLADTVSFPRGTVLSRVRLEPFAVEIGAIDLYDGATRASVRGKIAAESGGWTVALDAGLSEISRDKLEALWPIDFRPGLRSWLTERLRSGRITRFDAFVRHGAEGSHGGLDFAFEDAEAWILRDMPPLVDAAGRGQVIDGRFDLVLDKGRTGGEGPGQGVDLSGSRMKIADVRVKPALAQIDLAGRGPVGRFLEIIDQPPLQLLRKVGRSPDLAQGVAEVASRLEVPLIKELRLADVGVSVTAEMRDLAALDLVPGRPITAEVARLVADNDHIRIWGDADAGGVPMSASFARDFGPGSAPGRVEGTLEVTPQTVAALGIPLPDGTLEGRGTGEFALTLRADAPPLYAADVLLAGAVVRVPALDWSKSADSAGQIMLAGELGARPTVDRIALSGPGLRLEGQLELGEGGLAGAELSRLSLGNWLDAPVSWRPGTSGRAQVAIRGGRVDLRGGLPPQAGGKGGIELTLRPDEIVVAEKIRLQNVDGSITSGGRLLGQFTAQLNGQVPISGFLRSGGEVFLQSDNGGAALRAAGVFRNAFGGTLRVSLKGGDGPLSGVFSLKDATVVSDPALVTLLAEADAQGLARQVSGSGIGIDDAQGRFTIRDGRLRLSAARAVGPSLGITLGGTYGLGDGRIDMAGVISPLFAVNGLFQRLPLIGRALGGRPGEGLLGANFQITGTGTAPQIVVNPLTLLAPGAAREMFQSRARN